MEFNPVEPLLLRPAASKPKIQAAAQSREDLQSQTSLVTPRGINRYSFLQNTYFLPEDQRIEVDPFRAENPLQPNQETRPFSEVLQSTFDQFFS